MKYSDLKAGEIFRLLDHTSAGRTYKKTLTMVHDGYNVNCIPFDASGEWAGNVFYGPIYLNDSQLVEKL